MGGITGTLNLEKRLNWKEIGKALDLAFVPSSIIRLNKRYNKNKPQNKDTINNNISFNFGAYSAELARVVFYGIALANLYKAFF